MIARAASSSAFSDKSLFNSSITAMTRSCGNGSPMTPVDDVNTRSTGVTVELATADVIASTDTRPNFPVNALAFPEFTKMATPASLDFPILS